MNLGFLFSTTSLPSSRARELGVSLIETAVLFPLCILLLTGSIDLYIGINAYGALSQAAREGVASAATGWCGRNPDTGLCFTDIFGAFPIHKGDTVFERPVGNDYFTCLGDSTSDSNCGAIIIDGRVRYILRSLASRDRIRGGEAHAKVTVNCDGDCDGVQPGSKVTVTLTAPINVLSPFLRNFQLTVSASGPYGVNI